MKKASKNAISESFHTLQQRYGAGLPGRLTQIGDFFQQLTLNAKLPDAEGQLRHLVHDIAGSAGTFGFLRLSDLAREFDALLYRAVEENTNLQTAGAVISDLIKKMGALVEAGPDIMSAGNEELPANSVPSRLVYLIEDDPLQAEEVANQLRVFGWDVRCFGETTLAEAALKEHVPAAVIVDIGMPEGEFAGATMLSDFVAANTGLRLPRIFVSSRWDWPARLAAVQAGADAFFRKPFDVSDLITKLTELTETGENQPYRILIVDDMALLAEHYAIVLQAAGMHAKVVTDPAQLLAAVEDFSPELVLLDLYMPECSGVEAAKVLRQDSELIGLPIVYLSTELELSRQLQAMKIGADDFIEKPVEDVALVSIVSTRAARFRSLSSLMHRDSMTKLHNHSAIKLKLEIELGLARRSKCPLVFVMIDIDHFKLVNDSYGHPAGDRVIRSLAMMLKQRLRKSDFVGRYGGEEFAIVMPDTSLARATEVINTLREQFATITFPATDNFKCTFSAGVVGAGSFITHDAMIAGADEALYTSKHNGRNCVTSVSNT
jgi:diguanylate cyclase (GGDEF)-like protein